MDALSTVASLLRARNSIDADIARIMNRPMTAGHLGEWIASVIFDIALEESAVARAIDGRFRSGPLAGRTVNVKWYLKREGLLDVTEHPSLDYYLVLAGPRSSVLTSRGGTRPWTIDSVYLFHAASMADALRVRGAKIGVASSVRNADWDAAEVYPRASPLLPLSNRQREWLQLFRLHDG
jgi:hypothetical protein